MIVHEKNKRIKKLESIIEQITKKNEELYKKVDELELLLKNKNEAMLSQSQIITNYLDKTY